MFCNASEDVKLQSFMQFLCHLMGSANQVIVFEHTILQRIVCVRSRSLITECCVLDLLLVKSIQGENHSLTFPIDSHFGPTRFAQRRKVLSFPTVLAGELFATHFDEKNDRKRCTEWNKRKLCCLSRGTQTKS